MMVSQVELACALIFVWPKYLVADEIIILYSRQNKKTCSATRYITMNTRPGRFERINLQTTKQFAILGFQMSDFCIHDVGQWSETGIGRKVWCTWHIRIGRSKQCSAECTGHVNVWARRRYFDPASRARSWEGSLSSRSLFWKSVNGLSFNS